MLLVCLCGPATAQTTGGFPRDMVREVWSAALGYIMERHVEAATPGDLGLWSLRGLSVLDPLFTAERHEDRLRLLAAGRVIADEALPDAKAPPAAGLALTLTAIEAAAWNASGPLRRAGTDRMLASSFDELFNHLDPYSRYWSAEDARAARERRVGQSGLGLRLAAGRGDQVILSAVSPDGPAADAGLREGDRVISADGIALSAHDLGAAAAAMEGPPGSAAVLRIQRDRRRWEVSLIRRLVPPETVQAETRDGVLWLRVAAFSSVSGADVAYALLEAFSGPAPPEGVVLDLRGNRGGVLSQAVAMADAFLDGGIIARTTGRHPDAIRAWTGEKLDLAEGRPVVVLIDGRSASAAEVVAAALGDHGRAAVVGSTSMGKGLIQLLVPLPNGAEMSLSWSRILAPAGWPLQGLGVVPALCTSLGEEQLATQLASLARGQSPMGPTLERQRMARDPVLLSEVIALRSVCPPAEGRPADLAAARALLADPRAFRAAVRR